MECGPTARFDAGYRQTPAVAGVDNGSGMPTEALVCPSCRTWVEGSGRVVRCPACGQRFKADAARLDAARPRDGASAPDVIVPAAQDGWEIARTAEHHGLEASEAPEPTPVESPGALQESASDGWSTAPEPVAGGDAEPREQAMPLRLITTIAFLALIFVGRQYLSGEQFLVAFALLIAAQWLLNKRLGHG